MKNLGDKKIKNFQKPLKACKNCVHEDTVGCLMSASPKAERHVCSGHKFKIMF